MVVKDQFHNSLGPAVVAVAVVLVQPVMLVIQARQELLVLAALTVTQEPVQPQVVRVELLHSHGLVESDLQVILVQ